MTIRPVVSDWGGSDWKPRSRHVATQAEWETLREQKLDVCRGCHATTVELHHLIPKSLGGDDVADNLVPLCTDCHRKVHVGCDTTRLDVGLALTDEEMGHVLNRKGPAFLGRYYRVGVQVAGYPITEEAA